jgi:hypothetical protein
MNKRKIRGNVGKNLSANHYDFTKYWYALPIQTEGDRMK